MWPNVTPDDGSTLLRPLLFPFLVEKPAPAAFCPDSGIKLLEVLIWDDAYVA